MHCSSEICCWISPFFMFFFSQTQFIYLVYHDLIFHLKAFLYHLIFKPHTTDNPLTFKMFVLVHCRGLVQCNEFYNRMWLVFLSSFLLNRVFLNNNCYCFVNQALHCLWCSKALSNKVHKHLAYLAFHTCGLKQERIQVGWIGWLATPLLDSPPKKIYTWKNKQKYVGPQKYRNTCIRLAYKTQNHL